MNTHLEQIRAMGGLWKGGTQQQQQQQAGAQAQGGSSQASMSALVAAKMGLTPPAPIDNGAMTDAQFAAQMKAISNMNFSTPPAPVTPGTYSQGITTAPVAAATMTTGGNVSSV